MENRLKLRISRIFRSSIGSCRNLSDVVENAALPAHLHSLQTVPLLRRTSNAGSPLPSFCRPTCPDHAGAIDPSCIVSARRDVSRIHRRSRRPPPPELCRHYYSPLGSGPFYRAAPNKSKTKNRKKEYKQSRKLFISPTSHDTKTTYGWFSRDDDKEEDVDGRNGYKGDETNNTFSSITFSSHDSSAGQCRRTRTTRRPAGRNVSDRRRRETVEDPVESVCGHIEGSFAVEMRSSDPYGDFMESMVEMIVERRLFGPSELEQLVQCFLELNSSRHHAVIVAAYAEIWKTLFSSPPPRTYLL
ncbi:hypothetical protein SAY87_008726 [Trapa incisa]|uniref:Transcription repressor n=1 Tax=Trapa incisa TaxID=236973 RepID=A0AAN7PWD1_9MYRT|nr:hypothetical protein SAY87_008726 [Trapa incisa]